MYKVEIAIQCGEANGNEMVIVSWQRDITK